METDLHNTFNGKPFSEVEHLVNADGKYLYCNYWKPKNPTKFLIFLIHGFGGHSTRFEDFAKELNEIEGFVFSHDNVGHGESEGNRTTVDDYHIFIRDMFQHIDKIKSQYPQVPIFLLGQSMGGAISVVASHQRKGYFAGVILFSAMLRTPPSLDSSFTKIFLRGLNYIAPNFQLTKLDETRRDENETKIVLQDNLNSSVVKVEMAIQLFRLPEEVQAIIPSYSEAFMACHGTADTTCDIKGSKDLLENAKSIDKTLKIYKDSWHDLLHEPMDDRKVIFNDVKNWILERI